MRRRAFIATLGGAAAWPVVARAQRIERAPRVGVLLGSYTAADQAGQARIGTFLRALRELGGKTAATSASIIVGARATPSKIKGSQRSWFSPRRMPSSPRAIQ
jgi:hypothetical protein